MSSGSRWRARGEETPRLRVSEAVARQVWKSQLNQSIGELTLLRKSLLFAELSAIAYLGPAEAGEAVRGVGLVETRFFERDGAQAYFFANGTDVIVACRGTEPNDWNDIRADANAVTAVAEVIGRVHRGFKTEVDNLWPLIQTALMQTQKSLWFTGHSLGGAMATICAGRAKLANDLPNPEGLFTFGSPRVGNRSYVNYCKLAHYRWVNNNDIVTRVPPPWLGYRHSGREIYLNAYGKIRRMTGWQRTKDRWRGFLRSLRQGRVDHFSDHSMLDYIQHIHSAIVDQDSLFASNRTSLHHLSASDHRHRSTRPS